MAFNFKDFCKLIEKGKKVEVVNDLVEVLRYEDDNTNHSLVLSNRQYRTLFRKYKGWKWSMEGGISHLVINK